MNKEIITKRKNTYFKESIFVNGYAELDIDNIKKLSSSRKLLICITSKADLKRLNGVEYVYISTKKQYKDIKSVLENNNVVVITYKLIYIDLLHYSLLLDYLQRYKFTVCFLNRKKVKQGDVIVDEDFLDDNRMFLNIDYVNKTIELKEEFKNNNFYGEFELEYLKNCGLCNFLPYETKKFTLKSGRPTNDDEMSYEIKYYIIYGKKLDNELFLDKLCEYVPFIYESKDNQWYDIKIIREN
jgi:hypothetical protein